MTIYDGGFSSCGAFIQGRDLFVPAEDVVGAVDLVRAGTRLYAFWATGSSLKYKFATLGSTGDKSCTGSADPASGSCLTWSMTYTLLSGLTYMGVTAHELGGYIFIAYHNASNGLIARKLTVSGTGTLTVSGSWSMVTTPADYRSAHTPELVLLHTSGLPGTLAMVYLAESGSYRQFRWSGSGWYIFSYSMLDPAGSPITGGDSPAAIDWPDASATGFSTSEKRTVALLPDTSGNVRFYVLDYSTGRWTNVNLGSLGTTEGKPFLAYRHQRQADGSPRTDFPGNFMIGRMAPCDGGRCAHVRFSSETSRTTPPGPGMGTTYVADFLQNVWAITQPGASASLYSDSTIDNVFGLSPHAIHLTPEYGLNFYPHADGSPEHVYGIRSDFRVMEDGVCSVIGSYRSFGCGSINVLD